MSTWNPREKAAKALIDEKISIGFEIAGPDISARRAFQDLLHLVRSRTDLLRPRVAGHRHAGLGQVNLLLGLLALAADHQDWLRPAGDWVPFGAGPIPRFASLAQHLFSHYPLPVFMASVWYGQSEFSERRQGWYKHLGLGRNIRTADIPLTLTKRMAHEFSRAPDHYSVDMALRWGQVRGLGGSKELARAIVATRLGRSFAHEDFWRTVVHFVVNHPELELMHINPIVDYLHEQRFEPPRELTGENGPPQPNLSMKGRRPRSLLRQLGEWLAWKRRMKQHPNYRWPHSPIGEFRLEVETDGNTPRCWTIRELLSTGEICREGEAMGHCVGRYARACRWGLTSIWSMQFGSPGRGHRVLTIEVDPNTRTIRQARRRADAMPTAPQREILTQWARQDGLRIQC